MADAIRIKGLRELNRAFAQIDKDLKRELRGELREAAEPVRVEAQGLAVQRIHNIGPAWSQMRIGTTVKSVYIAPKQRRRRGSPRPNLAGLLLGEAMVPAVDAETEQVVDRLDEMLDRIGRRAGF